MGDHIGLNPPDQRKEFGDLDELFLTGVNLHLEQMSAQGFCMVVTRGDDQLRVSIYAPGSGRVQAHVEVDDGFEGLDT